MVCWTLKRGRVKLREITRTVLFTDIEGFSKLRKEIGDTRSFQILQHHDRILADSIKMYRGDVVKTVGDSIMAVFESPVNAAKCAVSIQNGLHRFNSTKTSAEEKIPPVRMGMSYGVMDEMLRFGQQDFLGGIVDKAFRVQSIANGQHIFLTDTDLAIIENRMNTQAITFHHHGACELKGIGAVNIVEILYKLPGQPDFITAQEMDNIDHGQQAEHQREGIMKLVQSISISGSNRNKVETYKQQLNKQLQRNEDMRTFAYFLKQYSDHERQWNAKPFQIEALCEFGLELFTMPGQWASILEIYARAVYRAELRFETEKLLNKALELEPDPQKRLALSDQIKRMKLASQAGRFNRQR